MKTKHHLPLPLRLLIFVILHSSFSFLYSQVPNIVSYQGRISVGTTNFTGTGQFRFALVDVTGANVYWSNSLDFGPVDGVPDAPVSLTVTKGLYSVLLGDPIHMNMLAIPASVWSNPYVYLRVWFDDGVNGNQRLTPDQRLTPNGYLPGGSVSSAAIADGAVTSAKIAAGSVTSVKLASGLTLGGTTSGTFSGNLTGNASTATNATSFTGALSGDVTGTQSATSIAATTVTGKALTGFSSTTGTITASDTILSAINKLNGNVTLKAPIASPTFTGTVSVPANGLVVGTNQLVATGGKIAIGTTIPTRQFQVDGNIPAILIGDEVAAGRTSLLMGVTANSGGNSYIQSTSSAGSAYGPLNLQPHGSNVGIGTDTPAAKLDVNGGINFSGIISGDGSALTNLNGGNLTAGSVTSAKIASNAVTTAKLNNGAVTAAKLSSDVGLWSVAGADVFRNSGNVGIGTTTPSQPLTVAGNTHLGTGDNAALAFDGLGYGRLGFVKQAGNNPIIASGFEEPIVFSQSNQASVLTNVAGSTFTERMRIDYDGNVGIGTTVPKGLLHVAGDYYGKGHLTLYAYEGDGVSGTAYIQGRDDSVGSSIGLQLRTQNAGAEVDALKIAPNGNVGIGMNNPGSKLTVEGDSNIVGYAGVGYGGVISNCALTVKKAAGSHIVASFLNEAGGTILQIGNSTHSLFVNTALGLAQRSDNSAFWSVTSDRRLKTGIVPIAGALDTVGKLNPVRYHYTAEHLAKMPGSVDKEHYGIVAQEYQELFPQFVTIGADGYLSVQSDPLIFVATAAIKELNAKHDAAIAAKDAEIAALKKQLSSIDARLARLEATAPVKVAVKK